MKVRFQVSTSIGVPTWTHDIEIALESASNRNKILLECARDFAQYFQGVKWFNAICVYNLDAPDDDPNEGFIGRVVLKTEAIIAEQR